MEGEKSLNLYPSNGSLTNPSKGNLGNPFGPELQVLFVNFVCSIKTYVSGTMVEIFRARKILIVVPERAKERHSIIEP